MADQSVPRRNQAYVLRTTLVSQADANIMQDPPTLAAGDVQRSIDGAAIANTTNAPALVPAGDKIAAVTLTAAEMNCDILVVTWADVVGAEWQDQTWILHPTDATLAVIYDYLVNTIYAAIVALTVICNNILTVVNGLLSSIVNTLLSFTAIRRALQSQDLELYRGDSWSQMIRGMGDLTGATDIWFAAKVDPDDLDSESIFLISETVGLEVINGVVAAVAANGSITVVGAATAGVIQIDFDEVETAKLVPDRRFWDAQKLVAGTVTTPKAGRMDISADIVRAVT